MSGLHCPPRFIEGRGSRRKETEMRWCRFKEMLRDDARPYARGQTDPGHRLRNTARQSKSFEKNTRPGAAGAISDLVKELDKLIWEKKLGGRVPRDVVRSLRSAVCDRVDGGSGEHRAAPAGREAACSRRSDFDDLQSRALKLLEDHPEVLRRASHRYRFFLVDEFQDTNVLQRDLMTKLAVGSDERVNLFIVGTGSSRSTDSEGADVDVFRRDDEGA